MMLPEDEKQGRRVEPSSDDDTYALSEPVGGFQRPRPTAPDHVTRARPQVIEEEPRRPEPSGFPFLTGVFTFPFYLRTLAAWGMMSIGLTVSALGVVFCVWLVDIGLLIGARCFALPVFLIGTLSLSYTAACCLTVIETTAEGYDAVVDWPAGFWRDWFWTLVPALCMLALAMAIGGILGEMADLGPWLPALLAAYLLFPIFLLSSLEAGSPMALVSWPVLRNLVPVWWAWLLFYVETGALFFLWLVPTVAAFLSVPFVFQRFVTVFVAGPFFAALLLIYARLVGRLAWCMGEYGYEEPED